MLSFLLLASTTGQPLPSTAVSRCTRPPVPALAFEPAAATTWRADGGHVVVAAWADRGGDWHVGPHGCTLTTAPPWPLAGRFSAPSGIPFELTERLGDGDDPSALGWLTGASTVVRVCPDGSGLAGTPSTGGGALHLAHGDGFVAISDRAMLAAVGAGGGRRRHDLPSLLRGTLLGSESAFVGVERLRPGGHVVLRGRPGAKVVEAGAPWLDGVGTPVAELAATAADDVARLLELAAVRPGTRVVELGDDPGSLVVAAALAATGTADSFDLRPRDGDDGLAVAAALAAALDRPLAAATTHEPGGAALDVRVRGAVARTEAVAAVSSALAGPLTGIADGPDVLVVASPGGALDPDEGPGVQRLLTSEAAATLAAADAEWRAGRGREAASSGARAVLAELDRRAPARQRAVADLAAGGTVLDPVAVPSVARLALAAADGQDATAALVTALHPPMLAHRAPQQRSRRSAEPTWRGIAPVLEAHVLGHARDEVAATIDLDEVALTVRSATPPDHDTVRALEGALTLGVWAAGTDVHRPSPAVVERRSPIAVPPQRPTIVTGVTSRSLLELAGLDVPLDAVEVDAMLGVRVDREVRDLVLRVLLAVGAAPGHLPGDLDDRLAGPGTAHLADAARTLLARRGGTVADPRLALVLPFWRVHVGSPRVVLVAERPPDLAGRSPAALPTSALLGWWVDAMTAAAAARADVRVVDPGDLADEPEPEAIGWEGLGEDDVEVHDLLRVVRTVDSLVREVELDAARPLLRTIRSARADDRAAVDDRPATPAAAPLHVVDQLWGRAVEADERLAAQRATADGLEARLAALEAELDDLRGRRGLKAAWHVLRGSP